MNDDQLAKVLLVTMPLLAVLVLGLVFALWPRKDKDNDNDDEEE